MVELSEQQLHEMCQRAIQQVLLQANGKQQPKVQAEKEERELFNLNNFHPVSKEKIVAHLNSYFLCSVTGIEADVCNFCMELYSHLM